MPPIPCAHCGVNFMRTTTDAEAPKLCNNCLLREQQKPRKEAPMENIVDILIKCPRQDQIEIEEICINQGIDFTRYFLELHYGSQAAIQEMKRLTAEHKPTFKEKIEEVKEEQKVSKKVGKK